MASLRRNERLAHKPAVPYQEIESGSRWQLTTLVDSNLPCTLSHVDFPYQMHPRRHADPSSRGVTAYIQCLISGITTTHLRTFRLRHFVHRHFVYRYFVYYDFPC